ncbi:MAG: DUF4178 domain-containing protein, partial [Candidatus Competibacteraceae bacterium]|nr:DUF4178 domain-containing protein [Candidatus Competibacteraceae bacterium]
VEYNGHWSLVHTLTEPPLVTGYGAKAKAVYQDRSYRHFQTAKAKVSYVLGEFYWRVRVGERCEISDYIAPPFQLSQERTNKEVVWSQAEYIEPDAIESAFRLETPPPLRMGIAPNQLSPYEARRSKFRWLLGVFLALLVIGQIVTLALSADQRVHQQTFVFDETTRNRTLSTEPFAVSGRESNLVIRAQTDLNNNWLYLDLALIDQQTGASTAIGREISYYHGIDGGERWSEGDAGDDAVLSGIPAGIYYLTVEGELPRSSPAVTCTLTMFRDVPSWSNFFLALLGLLILPMLFLWRTRAFERARWAESDYG